MNATQYKTEQEIQQLGLEVLHKDSGNYVEDRQEWPKQYSINQLINGITHNKADH